MEHLPPPDDSHRRSHAAAIGRCLAGLAAAALLSAAPAVRAEIWGFVDERGVGHFADRKLDDRYRLFHRGAGGTGSVSGSGASGTEAVPMPVRQAKLSHTVLVPAGPPPRIIAFFESSPAFQHVRMHLREAARTHRIDYELLQALIATESAFDPGAVSRKGAVGLMQIMPATAQRYGVAPEPRIPVAAKLTDPRTNIFTGTRYLRDLMDMFSGQLDLVLAAYNAGEGAVQRAGNRIPAYPETQNYVRTVLQIYSVLKPAPVATLSPPAEPPPAPEPVVAAPAPAPAAIPPGGAVGRGNMPPARLQLLPDRPV